MTVVTHSHKHVVHIAQHGESTEHERLKARIVVALKKHERSFEIFDELYVRRGDTFVPWFASVEDGKDASTKCLK